MPDSAPINRTATVAAVLALVAVIVVAAALLDLGPFSDDPASSGHDNQFLARGDQICADTHKRFDDQQREQPKTAAEAAQITKNLLELAQTELEQIRELKPPPALAKPLKKYLEARQRGIELLKKGIGAAEADDFTAYGRYQAELAAGALQRRRLAQAVGLSECSQPSLGRGELVEQSQAPKDSSLDRPNEVNNPPPGTP